MALTCLPVFEEASIKLLGGIMEFYLDEAGKRKLEALNKDLLDSTFPTKVCRHRGRDTSFSAREQGVM